MATTMSEPQLMRRLVLSPGLFTTRASSAPPTRAVGQQAPPPPVDHPPPPVALSPPAQYQAPGRAATTLDLLPGCPTPPMPSSTPSPEWLKARRRHPTRHWRLRGTTPVTVACWTVTPSWPTTTTATPPSTPHTAWASHRPSRRAPPMRCIQLDKGLWQGSRARRRAWPSTEAPLASPTHRLPLTIPKDTHSECRLMFEDAHTNIYTRKHKDTLDFLAF